MLRKLGDSKGISFDEEEASPMAGVSNLADAMLVLAVGIMLALVINWNIDVGTVSQIDQSQMKEISDYESISGDDLSSITEDSGLEKKGSVYIDPNTNKMYVIVNQDGE